MRLTDIRCAAARKGYRFGNCAICSVFDRSSLSAQWLAVTFRRRPFRRPAVPDGPYGGFTIGWNCLVHSRGGSNDRAGQFCGLAASDAAYAVPHLRARRLVPRQRGRHSGNLPSDVLTGPSSDAATPAGFIVLAPPHNNGCPGRQFDCPCHAGLCGCRTSKHWHTDTKRHSMTDGYRRLRRASDYRPAACDDSGSAGPRTTQRGHFRWWMPAVLCAVFGSARRVATSSLWPAGMMDSSCRAT